MSRRMFIIAIVAVLFLVSISAAYVFQDLTIRKKRNDPYPVLQSSAAEQVKLFHAIIEGKFLAMEALANAIAQKETDYDVQKNSIQKIGGFSSIAYVTPSGDAYLYDGRRTNLADKDYFIKSMKGERTVGYIEKSENNPYTGIVLSVPIKREYEIVGVVSASLLEKDFHDLLIPSVYDSQVDTFICDSDGNVIMKSDNEDSPVQSTISGNVNDSLKKGLTNKGVSAERVALNLLIEESGTLEYEIDGQLRYAIYQPININKWTIFNVVPASVADARLHESTKRGFALLAIILILALILIIIVVIMEKTRRRQLEDDRIELINANKDLTYSNERMRIALDSSSVVLWDYDIAKKRIIQNKRSAQVHGLDAVVKNVPESLVDSGFVHSDSAEEFLAMYDKLFAGEKTVEGVFKVQTPDRQGYWFEKIKYTNLFDEQGFPYKAIGTSEDVTELHKMRMAYNYWQKAVEGFLQDSILHLQYNLTKNVLIKCFNENSGYNFSNEIIENDFDSATNYFSEHFVYGDDREKYQNYINRERFFEAHDTGKTVNELEFRMLINGFPVWVRATTYLVEDPFSKDLVLYIFYYNIDKEKIEELEAEAKVHQDDLTGLLTRKKFISQVQSLFEEFPEDQHAFLMIDLDRFKEVNDTLGHVLGDKLLIEMASELESMRRDGDLICRLGGDEFIICLKNIPNENIAKKRADVIVTKLRRKINENLLSSVSVGIAIYPRDGKTFEELYKNADIALYHAKNNGKNCSRLYNKELEIKGYVSDLTPFETDLTKNEQ